MPNTNFLRFLISGTEVARISGEVDWTEVSFLVPTGPQVLRWEYVKTNAQVVGEDAAFLDQVEIIESTMPDLIITDVEFQPGEYVLERDSLPMQVTVKNQGAVLFDTDFVPSDLGVRLSVDKIWGNSDDVILGNFARVDEFDSGNRLVFGGDISLPEGIIAPTPEGSYYLAILMDPFRKLVEFDRDNNFFWSEPQAIEIRHLPNLMLDNQTPPVFDAEKSYFGGSTVRLDMSVVNRGLGDIVGEQEFAHEVQLRARPFVEDRTEPFDWVTEGQLIASLATIEESAFLPGISPQLPDGYSVTYENHLTLPDEASLLAALGLASGQGDLLTEWEFALVASIDVAGEIEESDETNNVVAISGVFAIDPLDVGPTTVEAWAANYGLTLPADPESPEYLARLMQYAFGMNPQLSDQKPETPFGLITVNEIEYFRITFDVVQGATDIEYNVEFLDAGTWVPILTLDPEAGIDPEDPLVVSLADQGHTATVTVRDIVPVEDVSSRILRVRVSRKD